MKICENQWSALKIGQDRCGRGQEVKKTHNSIKMHAKNHKHGIKKQCFLNTPIYPYSWSTPWEAPIYLIILCCFAPSALGVHCSRFAGREARTAVRFALSGKALEIYRGVAHYRFGTPKTTLSSRQLITSQRSQSINNLLLELGDQETVK